MDNLHFRPKCPVINEPRFSIQGMEINGQCPRQHEQEQRDSQHLSEVSNNHNPIVSLLSSRNHQRKKHVMGNKQLLSR
jgi:hypothetical protein